MFEEIVPTPEQLAQEQRNFEKAFTLEHDPALDAVSEVSKIWGDSLTLTEVDTKYNEFREKLGKLSPELL